jgi:hypothetical protein
MLFLPLYFPALQHAEHLWPLTNTVLANGHSATIEDLEEAQASRSLRRPPRPHPPDPLHDAFLVVAAAHQDTTRTWAKVV